MSIGSKIKSLRKSKKWSQSDLGEMIGVDRSNVSQWETDSAEPRLSNLRELAKVFEVDFMTLIEDEGVTIQPPPGDERNVMWAAIALLLNEAAQAKAVRENVSFGEAMKMLKKKGGPILSGLDVPQLQD